MTDNKKPTREEAEAAVRTMLAWTGDNPDREGLVETPKRVVRAYELADKIASMERDSIKVLKKILNSNETVDVNAAFKKEQQLSFQNKKNLLD